MASFQGARQIEGMEDVRSSAAANDENGHLDEIPRRLMRVKVLYTFEDENKSNCLARLPNALSIPTVSLDETTQLGVVELKACIQAIVMASPEIVAKLGHDYTVYAYDFSEYETPLVGQGLLSRILASASPTPKAPADQSQTMVTGRVCKNILGIFANGIKETLEVKLKLIPVPTCMQKEYVENMERYHSLSQLMPEGFDYSAWSDFLQANPTIGQLTRPTLTGPPSQICSGPGGGLQTSRNHSHDDGRMIQCSAPATRAASPALSTISYHPQQPTQISRPVSRASVRSEPPQYYQEDAPFSIVPLEQPEEGPPKKRARITKATRPKKAAALGVNIDSLRVTASTAASVRLHKPVATSAAADLAASEQVPRVPTPRPGEKFLSHSRALSRGPRQSSLRHGSLDESRPQIASFDSGIFSDNAIDSADDERGNSPGDTPMDIPSSPPLMPAFSQRYASSAPSSPGLPALPYPTDSGFVSDLPLGREDEDMGNNSRVWEGSDLPTAPSDPKSRKKRDRSHVPWTEVNPGPVELLPKSYVAKPRAYPRTKSKATVDQLEKVAEEYGQTNLTPEEWRASQPKQSVASGAFLEAVTAEIDAKPTRLNTDERTDVHRTAWPSVEMLSGSEQAQPPSVNDSKMPLSAGNSAPALPPLNEPAPIARNASLPASPAVTPGPAQRRPKAAKPRGLPRSQTWSGEVMSDPAGPSELGIPLPRSGSGARRKQDITTKLNQSIRAGEMPTYCNNCGEIETPTWRKAFTRIEDGLPTNVEVSCEGTGIIAFEAIEPTDESDNSPKYRIFKQNLDKHERELDCYTVLTLCNPCGLWLYKKNAMRPRKIWEKSRLPEDPNKPKRKRKPRPRKTAAGQDDGTFSDAAMPQSEPAMREPDEEARACSDEAIDPRLRNPNAQPADQTDHYRRTSVNAATALQRAIQSSPPGFMSSKNSTVEPEEPDLTPKPTRRLLFPSPRKSGETRSLGETSSVSPTRKAQKLALDENTTASSAAEGLDKENRPPPATAEHDEFAHLFEEPTSPKTTPTKGLPTLDLLKTPTPGSRKRIPLTPQRGIGNDTDRINLATPSRNLTTPNRSGRVATVPPETPFTRQLNALMSDCISSPSQAIDFSMFSGLNMTPQADTTQFSDFMSEDFLSSDMPMPSSPSGGLGFSLYEDPSTSTVGLWSGVSVFEGSDPLGLDEDGKIHGGGQEQEGSTPNAPEVSVNFAAMLQQVVSAAANSASPESPPTDTPVPHADAPSVQNTV